MRGKIRNFTGVSSPYERSERLDGQLDTKRHPPHECVEMVMLAL